MIGTTFDAGSIRSGRTISIAGEDHWDESDTMFDPVPELHAYMISGRNGPFRYKRYVRKKPVDVLGTKTPYRQPESSYA